MPVELDAQLLEILACPSEDHAPLRVGTPQDPAAEALTCTACGRQFPVRDGIPVLLLDEASAPGGNDPRGAAPPANPPRNKNSAGTDAVGNRGPTHHPEPEGAGDGV